MITRIVLTIGDAITLCFAVYLLREMVPMMDKNMCIALTGMVMLMVVILCCIQIFIDTWF